MKACVKSIYGSPVNAYMRALRMDRAALRLRKEPETVGSADAGAVGYDSARKCAGGFGVARGQTPVDERRGGGKPGGVFQDEREGRGLGGAASMGKNR